MKLFCWLFLGLAISYTGFAQSSKTLTIQERIDGQNYRILLRAAKSEQNEFRYFSCFYGINIQQDWKYYDLENTREAINSDPFVRSVVTHGLSTPVYEVQIGRVMLDTLTGAKPLMVLFADIGETLTLIEPCRP